MGMSAHDVELDLHQEGTGTQIVRLVLPSQEIGRSRCVGRGEREVFVRDVGNPQVDRRLEYRVVRDKGERLEIHGDCRGGPLAP